MHFALTTGHLLLKEPQLSHITISSMKNDWKILGNQLKIPVYELQSIERTNQRQMERLIDVFAKWKNSGCSPYTFQNLLDCLKSMGQNDNSPSVRAIYENLKEHRAEYENEPDYIDYTNN